ncbi:polymer-forming cytoskeletal protein [Comamonas sp. w2-DMI]|uniref:polymer-forming cytoskeletal protein n=1 Tax=Comamonas sp. w2-DMI TaxID=3126391 RepID=UPI0032E46505
MSAFNLDFNALNVRSRIPTGAVIEGNAQFPCGLLLEGTLNCKEQARVGGALVLLHDGLLSGEVEIDGDAYILGTIHAERVVIKGKAHFAEGSTITGCVHAKDYQVYAGAAITASLLQLP